jgi:hypothetical protein
MYQWGRLTIRTRTGVTGRSLILRSESDVITNYTIEPFVGVVKIHQINNASLHLARPAVLV